MNRFAILACALALLAFPASAQQAVTISKGEGHCCEVGGNQASTSLQPTTTVATYTAGQVIGGLQTVTSAERVAGKGGLIQSAVLALKVANTVSIDVVYFNANPTASTCNNAAAYVLAPADIGKVIGVAHVTDWTAGNIASVGQSQNMAAPYVLPSGTSAFSCAVVRGSITTTSTADLNETTNVIRN
jgi:hypothetical protein